MMEEIGIKEKEIWSILDTVSDPEIPVVSVVEMGIVRDVSLDGNQVLVIITPTFSGFPALQVMSDDIENRLSEFGYKATVEKVHHPPWTSDWISDGARQKLKQFGLAPPPKHGGRVEVTFFDPVPCPYCDSKHTTAKNSFGSTLCRAIYYCNSCQQPFEQFKAL
jgi:ring-1,2-phenylacetyl-CoA epoxidase subunit PaaD